MDESQKQRVMLAIVAFNLTIITYQLIFNMNMFGFTFTWVKLALGLVLAAVVGGAAYVGAQFMQR
jgi:hypothetical protein